MQFIKKLYDSIHSTHIFENEFKVITYYVGITNEYPIHKFKDITFLKPIFLASNLYTYV